MIRRWTLRGVLLGGAIMAMACTGMDLGFGPSVRVTLSSADGLAAGHPVTLNGIAIGSVRSVDFAENGDGVVAVLSISKDNMARLDPDTLFIVRDTQLPDPPRVVIANNLCVETPRGLQDAQILNGYSGKPAQVLFQAGKDRPECANRLVEKLLNDLSQTIEQL